MRSAESIYSRTGDERGQPLAERLVLPLVAMVGFLAMSMVGLAIATV